MRDLHKLVLNCQIVSGFVPSDLSTGTKTGDWLSLKLYGHLAIVVHKSIATTGQDATVTIQQATSVGGGGAKPLTFTELWVKQAVALNTVGEFTRVTQAAANTYTSATSGESQCLWVIEFDASQLDVNNNYDCVRASVNNNGQWPHWTSVLYILPQPRYLNESPLSAIVD